MDEQPALSLSSLLKEREELRKDYVSFSGAYDLICMRLNECAESEPRNPPLHQWSGSRAVCGTLEMSIHAIERTIEEHNELIRKIEAGEIRNLDRPGLSLVKETE